MNLTEISIRRPSIIIVIFTVLMIGGYYCYTTLRYELLPPMEVPTLVITTPYPGASPDEVEQSVTRKVEDVVSALDRVKSGKASLMKAYRYSLSSFRSAPTSKQKSRKHSASSTIS